MTNCSDCMETRFVKVWYSGLECQDDDDDDKDDNETLAAVEVQYW